MCSGLCCNTDSTYLEQHMPAYPAVTIRFTANGVTFVGTVDVMVIPEHVDVGGERIAGVDIQPEHIAEAFPSWSENLVNFVRDVVAYAWNEGGIGTHDATWADFPAYDGTDAVGVLSAQYNPATGAACAVA
jgi:hypothetical protein